MYYPTVAFICSCNEVVTEKSFSH